MLNLFIFFFFSFFIYLTSNINKFLTYIAIFFIRENINLKEKEKIIIQQRSVSSFVSQYRPAFCQTKRAKWLHKATNWANGWNFFLVNFGMIWVDVLNTNMLIAHVVVESLKEKPFKIEGNANTVNVSEANNKNKSCHFVHSISNWE